jgi:hypothetical protein
MMSASVTACLHRARCLDGETVFCALDAREVRGFRAVAGPDPDASQRAHGQHGLKMASRLLACAQQRQIARIRVCEEPGGQAARGRRANGGDLGGIEQRHGLPVLGLEQQHQSQMRRIERRLIARDQAHELHAEALGVGEIARHVAEHAAVAGHDHDRAKRQYDAPLRHGDHGAAHEIDAFGHGQKLPHLGPA